CHCRNGRHRTAVGGTTWQGYQGGPNPQECTMGYRNFFLGHVLGDLWIAKSGLGGTAWDAAGRLSRSWPVGCHNRNRRIERVPVIGNEQPAYRPAGGV